MHWEELEVLLNRASKDADKLSELFVKVSSDLSYARTYFPNRSVRLYLNNLTQRVFDSLRTKEDKFKFSHIIDFFKHQLPQEIYNSRNALLTSFFVFAIAMFIGVISSKYEPDFVKQILGHEYVRMTEENIAKGDPMAVYKDERKIDMLFGITSNNIRVALLTFAFGIIGSIGSIIILLSNGIMVGAFQYFFVTKGLFWESFLTIWIHGTIEISAIIIAGGAGIVIGNGLLFPKTHNRSTSMQIAAMRALRIILGTLPLFVIAGLLESFVTRQTELPTVIRVLIIAASAILIAVMWIIYPWYYHKNNLGEGIQYDLQPISTTERKINPNRTRTIPQVISDGLFYFRSKIGLLFGHAIVPTLLVVATSSFLYLKINQFDEPSIELLKTHSLSKISNGSWVLPIIYLVLASYIFCMIEFITREEDRTITNKMKFLKSNYLSILLFTSFLFVPFTFVNYFWGFIWIVLSPHFFVTGIQMSLDGSGSILSNLKSAFKFSFNTWLKFIVYYIIAYVIFSVVAWLRVSQLFGFIEEFFKWHELFDTNTLNNAFTSGILDWTLFVLFATPVYYFLRQEYYSLKTELGALDLKDRLKSFGNSSTIFETS